MYGSFYRRPLPQPPAIAFSSRAGREIFTRSLRLGYMERFFPLCEQFRTQEEPSFCGISTLAMILNAMGQDPGRVWKGPWRYYHEDMLTCCVPLQAVKIEGITFRQLECLARCNGASVKSYLSQEPEVTLELFRESVKKSTAEGNDFMIVAYSRAHLGQTGDGHFSPIGGYDPENDLVLILDVARFKYPPHWVELKLLFEATKLIDASTGRSRGFMVLTKRNLGHSIYFLISQRTQSWREFIDNVKKTLAPLCCSVHASCDSAEDGESLIVCITKRFSNDALDMFSTYINEFSLNHVSEEHHNQVQLLLEQLRATPAFRIVSKCQHLIPASDVPAKEILTLLLLALPRSTWEDMNGMISPCARYFVMDSMPEPLNNEVLAIRYQLEALLTYCNYTNCV